jgi:hypothetical protein
MSWVWTPSYNAWIADCGPYTGPWPPDPPASLPSGCTELDFYAAFASGNPDTPIVAQPFYPDDFAESYLYLDGSTPTPGTTVVGSFATGMHLWVVWFNIGFTEDPTPPVEALSLVPTGYVGPPVLPDLGDAKPGVHLYDKRGHTLLANLTNARKVAWQDELSKMGSGSFEVPLADASTALIADRCIVKFSLFGAIRMACRIVTESCVLAVDGITWLRFENQPGLLSLLGDAVVLPEYGLGRRSRSQRNFGFMSADGPWRVTSDWGAPLGNTWATDVPRHGYPPTLRAANPYWIAASPGPAVAVPAGTVNYFRHIFNTASPTYVNILATADNFLTLYVDGDEIISPNPEHPFGWREAPGVSLVLSAGNHVFAAKVENAVGLGTGGSSPIGFILAVQTLDTSGVSTGVVMRTNLTDWIAHDGTPEPGWFRAQVLKTLFDEAVARGVVGPSYLTLGFTATADSASAAWTDRGQFVFSVASQTLAEVATQLAETLLDVHVDPVAIKLNAWNRKGSDKSATVQLKLGADAGTLKAYETTKSVARRTRVVTQLADGSWTTTTDDAGLAAVGLVETGASVGSASSVTTAYTAALAVLKEAAAPLMTASGEPSTLTGAKPYVDYQLGDTITVPGHRGGTAKARVLAITVDGSSDTVRAWPELAEDRSGVVDVDVPRRLRLTPEERLRIAIDRGAPTGSTDIRAATAIHIPIPTITPGSDFAWDYNSGSYGGGVRVFIQHTDPGDEANIGDFWLQIP